MCVCRLVRLCIQALQPTNQPSSHTTQQQCHFHQQNSINVKLHSTRQWMGCRQMVPLHAMFLFNEIMLFLSSPAMAVTRSNRAAATATETA